MTDESYLFDGGDAPKACEKCAKLEAEIKAMDILTKQVATIAVAIIEKAGLDTSEHRKLLEELKWAKPKTL